MSALPPKADIGTQPPDVRFVPKADILHCGKEMSLFDHLIGLAKQRKRYGTGTSAFVHQYGNDRDGARRASSRLLR